MNLSVRSLSAIGKIITGDEGLSPYRSGPKLVRLFNNYGANDIYEKGFPSRWKYTEEKLVALNNSSKLGSLIKEILDPREFLDSEFEVSNALEFLNKWICYDGYQIIIDKGFAKIRNFDGMSIECNNPFEGSENDNHLFIDEQIEKAEKKIQEGDYDGAITNARSLIEAVLTELEKQIDPKPLVYDGDLPKLYKRVSKNLNLNIDNKDIEGPLKQVLSGLSSIIYGISGISNKMGDRHVRKYKPNKHHAVLVVNSSKTISNFFFESWQYQNK